MDSKTPNSKRGASASSSSRKALQSSTNVASHTTAGSKRTRDMMAPPASTAKPARKPDLTGTAGSSGQTAASGEQGCKAGGAATAPTFAAAIARAVGGNQSIVTAVRIKPCEPGQRDGFEEGRGAVTRGKDGRTRIEMAGDVAACSGEGSGSSSSAGTGTGKVQGPMKAFAPEHVFLGTSTQAEVYDRFARDIVLGVLGGVNGCLTAYGQTGSGKTHTMLGDPTSPSGQGVIPRSLRTLFSGLQALKAEAERTAPGTRVDAIIRSSYVEVYQENVYDLLAKEAGGGGGLSGSAWVGSGATGGNGAVIPGGPKLLKIRGDDSTGFFLDGVTEVELDDPEMALDVLSQGFAARRTTSTAMNARSSRSHAILSLAVAIRTTAPSVGQEGVEKVSEREAVLDVVDLAGSERQRDTGAEGSALKEAGKINNSLSHLAEVIKTLLENSMAKHSKAARPIPWRNSKLTMLLRRSLAGNSRTAMIFAITPASEYWSESINTLQFADRARKLKTEPSTNERTVLMGGTNQQITVLQKELATAKALIAQLSAGGGGAVRGDALHLLSGLDGAHAMDDPSTALDFSAPPAHPLSGGRAWASLLSSSVGGEVDATLGPTLSTLCDGMAGATAGLTRAAARLVAAGGEGGVVSKLLADSLVLRASLSALQTQGSSGQNLASGLADISSRLQTVLMAHGTVQQDGAVHTTSTEEGEEEEDAARSPKLQRTAVEEDTGAARVRHNSHSSTSPSEAGSGVTGTPSDNGAFDMTGRNTAGFTALDRAAMDEVAEEEEGRGGDDPLLAAVRASLFEAGAAMALTAGRTALGLAASSSFALPVLVASSDARGLRAQLLAGASVLSEGALCIPALFGEVRTLTARLQASVERSSLGDAGRAVAGKGGKGAKRGAPGVPAPAESAEQPPQQSLPAHAFLAVDEASTAPPTAGGMADALSGSGSSSDAFKSNFARGAQGVMAQSKPRVSSLTAREITRQADARTRESAARARSSSIVSTTSLTVSRHDSMLSFGGWGGGGHGDSAHAHGPYGVPSGSGSGGVDAMDEDGQVAGQGMDENGMEYGGACAYSAEDAEAELAGGGAGSGGGGGHPSRAYSMGAADVPEPKDGGMGVDDALSDGGCGQDAMGEEEGGYSPGALGGGGLSARSSGISPARSSLSIGTSISGVIERTNLLNATASMLTSGHATQAFLPDGMLLDPTALEVAARAAVPPSPAAAHVHASIPAYVQAPVYNSKPATGLRCYIAPVATAAPPAPAEAAAPAKPSAPVNLLKPSKAAPAPAAGRGEKKSAPASRSTSATRSSSAKSSSRAAPPPAPSGAPAAAPPIKARGKGKAVAPPVQEVAAAPPVTAVVVPAAPAASALRRLIRTTELAGK